MTTINSNPLSFVNMSRNEDKRKKVDEAVIDDSMKCSDCGMYPCSNQFCLRDDAVIDDSMKCSDCDMYPCFAAREYDNMAAIGLDLEADNKSNNEIRYALYGYMPSCYNGYLGAGNRKKLPACVEGEIRDAYPKVQGTEYVGFRAKKTGEDDE